MRFFKFSSWIGRPWRLSIKAPSWLHAEAWKDNSAYIVECIEYVSPSPPGPAPSWADDPEEAARMMALAIQSIKAQPCVPPASDEREPMTDLTHKLWRKHAQEAGERSAEMRRLERIEEKITFALGDPDYKDESGILTELLAIARGEG